jgi:DNA polymerase III subunit epsilon
VDDALDLISPRRRRRADPARRIAREDRPDLSRLPDDPGVYVFCDEHGRPLYVGKSVSIRTRARAHFTAPAGWTERAEIVDYKPTNSELGALVLENRLIKRWKPAGNVRLKRTDGYVYLRARLDIAYPILEVSSEPAHGRAVNVGPMRGRALANELVEQLDSLFQLRHCGRGLKLREHPSAYGQMGRCLSPCLNDLDPNLYRRRLDEALAVFDGPGEAGERLLQHLEERMREAAAERRFERAEVLRRRRERMAGLLERLDGVLRATSACSRLVLARHPAKPRFDAFWILAGRVIDWGPLGPLTELLARTDAALAKAPRCDAPVPVDEVDEVRIAGAWIAAHEPPWLPLDEPPDRGRLAEFVIDATDGVDRGELLTSGAMYDGSNAGTAPEPRSASPV